jgi:hypothetical protein
MDINFSFSPDPSYSGSYIISAFDADDPLISLGQVTKTGPFGSTVAGTIAGVAVKDRYLLRMYTSQCGSPVGEVIIVPGQYKATRNGNFTKNNCPSGQAGTVVPFSKEYTSNVSQQAAQDLADGDSTFNTQGQANANSNGACTSQIVPVPFYFVPFDTTGQEPQSIMADAPTPYNNDYYSYLYKNLQTGHYVFRLSFVMNRQACNNNGVTGQPTCFYTVGSPINGNGIAKIARISNPLYYPAQTIVLSGVGYNGGVISGEIDTDGYIKITGMQSDKAISGNNINNPSMFMMNLKNDVYAAEFAAQGIYTN